MKESDIKSFLDGDLDPGRLEALAGEDGDDVDADLDEDVPLSADDLVRMCDAQAGGSLSLASLSAVASAILASDRFVWDERGEAGERIAEVLWDWSEAGDEEPLTPETVARHRTLLLRPEAPGREA